jgi:hypothetical protein
MSVWMEEKGGYPCISCVRIEICLILIFMLETFFHMQHKPKKARDTGMKEKLLVVISFFLFLCASRLFRFYLFFAQQNSDSDTHRHKT